MPLDLTITADRTGSASAARNIHSGVVVRANMRRPMIEFQAPAGGMTVVTSKPPIELPFAYGDASPRPMGTFSGVIVTASVLILSPFNDPDSRLRIGSAVNPDLLMTADQNLPQAVGRYETNPAVRLAAVPLILTIEPGPGETQGAGLVYLEIAS